MTQARGLVASACRSTQALDAAPRRHGEVLHHGRDAGGGILEQPRPKLRVRTAQRLVRSHPRREQLEALGQVALRRGPEAQARDAPRYIASAHDRLGSVAAAAHARASGDDVAADRRREIAVVAIGMLGMVASCSRAPVERVAVLSLFAQEPRARNSSSAAPGWEGAVPGRVPFGMALGNALHGSFGRFGRVSRLADLHVDHSPRTLAGT
jgi:hypothetical protein